MISSAGTIAFVNEDGSVDLYRGVADAYRRLGAPTPTVLHVPNDNYIPTGI
jgi:hypothetical protein